MAKLKRRRLKNQPRKVIPFPVDAKTAKDLAKRARYTGMPKSIVGYSIQMIVLCHISWLEQLEQLELVTPGHLTRVKKAWQFLYDNVINNNPKIKGHMLTVEEVKGYESKSKE